MIQLKNTFKDRSITFSLPSVHKRSQAMSRAADVANKIKTAAGLAVK